MKSVFHASVGVDSFAPPRLIFLTFLLLLFASGRISAQTPPCEPPDHCGNNPEYYCGEGTQFYWAMIPDGQGNYNIYVRHPSPGSLPVTYFLVNSAGTAVASLNAMNGVFSNMPPDCYTIVICFDPDGDNTYCCKQLPCDFGDPTCCELSYPFFTDIPNPTWQFGDATTSTQQNVRHEYTNINTYPGEGTPQATVTLPFGTNPIVNTLNFPQGIWVGKDCIDSGNSSVLQNSVNPSLLVFPILSYSNRNISIRGSITMDQNYAFTACDICMNRSARIVSMAKQLSFLTNTVLHEAQCDHKGFAWYGVEVQRGTLVASGATFVGAYNAIYTPPNPVGMPTYQISSCNFNRNYLGIKVLAPLTFGIFTDNTLGAGSAMLNWPILEPNPCPAWVSLISKPVQQAPFAGIYAETPANQPVVSLNLPPTTNPNVFINLSNGIYLVDANAYVRRSRFENMLSGAYPNDDGFGIALFTNNTRSLEQLGLGKTGASTPLTFDNCRHAVYVSMNPQFAGGSVLLRSYNNRMSVENGYTVLGGYSELSAGSVIQNNDISFWGLTGGIFVENAATTTDLLITQNTITATNPQGVGITLLNYFVPPGAGTDYRVRVVNNSSVGFGTDGIFGGEWGVEMARFSNVLVENNTVGNFTGFGIYNVESPDNDIRCNDVSSINGLRSIYNHLSANMLMEYNRTDATDQGISISNASNNSTITCNQIGSHDIGLYYDALAVTGPQLFGSISAGNTWTGTYANWAAYNANPMYGISQFFYRTGEINPGQVFPPLWFTLVPNGVTCEEGCPHAQEQERMVTALDLQISEDSTGAAGLTDYLLKTALYRDLLNYPQLLQSNAAIQNFYDNFGATNGGILTAMDKTIADAALPDAGQQAEWNAAQNELTAAFTALAILDSLAQTGEADPEDDQGAERAALMQQILAAQTTLDNIYNANLTARAEAAPGLLQTLNGLDAQTPYEANQRDLDRLILKTGFVDLIPSNDQIEQILQIAQQCPDQGGPAVDQARAWYYLLTGTRLESACEGADERKIQDFPTGEQQQILIINPNPANDRIVIRLTNVNSRSSFDRLEIADPSGKVVWTKSVSRETSTTEVQTGSFAKGFYVCRLIQGGKVTATAKFTLQH